MQIQNLKNHKPIPGCGNFFINAATWVLISFKLNHSSSLLASEIHSYWSLGKDNIELRFINDKNTVSNDRLVFLKIISNVIKSGMTIVGVNVPEKM